MKVEYVTTFQVGILDWASKKGEVCVCVCVYLLYHISGVTKLYPEVS